MLNEKYKQKSVKVYVARQTTAAAAGRNSRERLFAQRRWSG